jgi:hypothetical protein
MGLLARRQKPADKAGSNRIERLFSDQRWIAEYRITPEEIESLSTVAMMGELKSEHDVLFVLNQIRRARLRV